MKKILVLICFVLGVSNVWAYVETTLTVQKTPTSGAGTAGVDTSEEGTYSSSSQSQKTGKWYDATGEHTYYLMATTTSQDWLWKGWACDGNIVLQSQKGLVKVKDDDTWSSVKKTYTATWVQPMVSDVNNPDVTVTDRTATPTAIVTFSLGNDLATNNYTEMKELGNNMSLQGNVAYTAGSYQRTIAYSPTGVHGTVSTGTLKLTSKYPQSGGSSKTSTITFREDYTPAFTVKTPHAISTPENKTIIGVFGQVAIADLIVSRDNYAATTSLSSDEKINGCEWKYAFTQNESGFFTIENNMVKYTPQSEGDHSATLKITCTYYDASGNPVPTDRYVVITASAKEDTTPRVEIGGGTSYIMDFGTVNYGTSYTKKVAYVAAYVTDVTETWNPSTDQITRQNAGTEITISLLNELACGDYTETLTYSDGTHTATLTIKANVRLEKPVLCAYGGIHSVTLAWNAIAGASSYIIKTGDTEVETVDASKTTYTHTELTDGTQVSYTVTAVYDTDEIYNITSEPVYATPGIPNVIVQDNAKSTGIYTGTEGESTILPYKPKWQVNLSSTFDASGKALFDRLYIFGETKGKDGADLTYYIGTETEYIMPNTITPCYIYEKSSAGDSYEYKYMVSNMNVDTKNKTWFDVNLSDSSAPRSLYLTGWCPCGTTGYTTDEHGLLRVVGTANTSVDIYMEECYLYARVHKKDDRTLLSAVNMEHHYVAVSKLVADNVEALGVPGPASSIVLESSVTNPSQAFKPNIHIKGNNHVYGHRGCAIGVSLLGSPISGLDMGQYSAPIYMRPTAVGAYTTLTMDDIWPVDSEGNRTATHTNGYLEFSKELVASPSIDLGNENGVVNFNGGRFALEVNQPTQGNYINNLTIGMRSGQVVYEGIQRFMGLGVGADGVGGTVNINDGSVYVKKFNVDVQTWGGDDRTNLEWYEDLEMKIEGQNTIYYSQTLRCPEKTFVHGGSHKGYIRACANTDNSGASPTDGACPLEQRVYNVSSEDLLDGFVQESYFINGGNGLYETETVTCADCHLENKLLKEYYNDVFTYPMGTYGRNAIAPEDGKIYLWVPGAAKKPVSVTYWQVFMPYIKAGASIGVAEVGVEMGGYGSVHAETYEDHSPKHIVKNLLYCQLDNNIVKAQSPKLPTRYQGSYMYADIDDSSFPGDSICTAITNAKPYEIKEYIYYLRMAVADEWITFCAPFDVKNIYVVEACNEEILKYVSRDKGRKEALAAQAMCNTDFAALVGVEMVSNSASGKLWDYFNNKYIPYVDYIRGYSGEDSDIQKRKTYYLDYGSLSGTSNIIARTRLQHLVKGGTPENPTFNYDIAHYYLYQVNNDDIEYESATNDDEDYLKLKWQLAPNTTTASDGSECVLKKGQVYAMQFPYCPGCNNGTEWDYWTGKFLVFEGFGPQTISGVESHDDIITDHPTGLYGNYTLGKIKLEDYERMENAYVNSKNQFVQNLGEEILPPGESFLVVNPESISNIKGRVKSVNIATGAITWEDDNNTTTGTPTISGNRQMMVYTIEGGVGIIPVTAQQVSIYNAAGQLITSQYLTDEVQISLPTGIYLVSGEKDQAKVIVK